MSPVLSPILMAAKKKKLLKVLVLARLWQKWKQRTIQPCKPRIHKTHKTRIYVRPMFEEHQIEKFGAGTQLMEELKKEKASSTKKALFRNFFRMDQPLFVKLLSLVAKDLQKVDTRRKPIASEIRLAITLRYLASGDSMTSLSYLYRVGVATISKIIAETTVVIWNVLHPIVLKPPDLEKWLESAKGFAERWQYPNCIGAIDGKHVVIQAPPHSGSQYYIYKGCHSIVLMAVLDYDCSFTLIDIGAYGRQSDGGIFSASLMGKKLKNNTLNLPPPREISEGRPPMPFVIVGDEAFPLMENLMRPYPFKSGLGVEEAIYNMRHSRARRVSENGFGILVQMWRIFRKPIIAKVENVMNMIKAAVCLHNFVMRNAISAVNQPGILEASAQETPSELRNLRRIGANTSSAVARSIRDEFKSYFNEEGALPWQFDRL